MAVRCFVSTSYQEFYDFESYTNDVQADLFTFILY